METYLLAGTRCLLGTVFAVAFFGKARHPSKFRLFVTSVRKLTMSPPQAATVIALAIVTCEGIAATLLALPVAPKAGFALAAGLLALFIAGVVRGVRGGVLEQCRCFGSSGSLMSLATIVRNLLLMAFALTGLLTTAAVPDASTASWPSSPAPAGGPATDPRALAIALAAGLGLAVFFTRYYDHILRAVVMRLEHRRAQR